ncbi:TolC family protein [bacterium]|nr:TolC family protein [bacterium]
MFTTIIILLFPLLLFAQEIKISENSKLSDLIYFATLNNPQLKAKFSTWKASLEVIPQVGTLPDPNFTFSYFAKGSETQVARLNLMQMFPFWGKLGLMEKMAFKESEAMREDFEMAKLELIFEVKENYFMLYQTAFEKKITEKNLKLLEEIYGIAQVRYQNNQADFSELLQTEIETEQLKDKLLTLNQMLEVKKAKLNLLLNRSEDDFLPEPKLDSEEPELENLTEKLLQNPQIKMLGFLLEKEKIGIALSKREILPDFTLGTEYTIMKPGTSEHGTPTKGDDEVMLMFGVNIPLWQKKYSAKKQQAILNKEATEHLKSNKISRLKTELEEILFALQEAERKILLYENKLLPKEKQNLELTKTAYQNGQADLRNLLETQKMMLEFEMLCEMAKTNKAVALAKIKMLTN